MSRINRPATLNRSLLGLLGLLLIAAGGALIAAHYGAFGRLDTGSTLVPGTAAPRNEVFVAVIVGAVVLGLLCLRWLLAQPFRMPKPVTWLTRAPDAPGTTELASTTAAAPVAADIEGYEGVRSAGAWIRGARSAPELHLLVTVDPDADVAALRGRIRSHAVARLCQALEVEVIPVTLELRFEEERRPARVR